MGREGADFGGGETVPSQGERAGRDPRGPGRCRREVPRSVGARGLVGGGRQGARVTLRPGAARRGAAARAVGAEWEGIVSGSQARTPCFGGPPGSPRGSVRWVKRMGSRSGSGAPGPGHPAPQLFALRPPPRSPSGTQACRLPAPPPPPRLRRARLPGAPLLLSLHPNGASPSSPPKRPVMVVSLLNSIKRVLFHTSRDASPGHVRGEESCREKARTPGCGLTPWNWVAGALHSSPLDPA